MKNKSGILLAIIILITYSCRQSNSQDSDIDKTASKIVRELAQTDTLGPIIYTIDIKIQVTREELKDYDEGFISWISIDKPKINKLIDANKIILPYKSVSIIIDYPLRSPAVFEIASSGKGFSRKQLITEICNRYHDIYKLEESTAKTKTIPVDKRKGLINRNQTDGKYGVWGHDITDLDLSLIEVHKNSKGKITLTLGIES